MVNAMARKRLIAGSAATVAVTLVAGFGMASAVAGDKHGGDSACPAKGEFTLTLLHHNDGESDLLPGDAGGVARFAGVVDQAKAEATTCRNTAELLVSAGDNFLAGKEFNASQARTDGGIYDAEAMNAIGYDAITLGNHDFDFGPSTTANFISQFTAKTSGDPARRRPTFLAANLDFGGEKALRRLERRGRIAGSTVVKLRGHKVGVVGATTENLPFISAPGNVKVNPVIPAVQAEINALQRRGVNKIIMVSHLQGIAEDTAVAEALKGVDIYVAGGGDDLLANPGNALLEGDEAEGPYPQNVDDAEGVSRPIVSVDGGYTYVGRLVATFNKAGDITAIGAESGPIANFPESDPRAAEPNAEIQSAVVDPVQAFVEGLEQNVVATASVVLDGERDSIRGKETNLGNLVADAQLTSARELSEVEDDRIVAAANGGGIRIFDTLTGPINEAQTFDILPFDNRLTVIEDVTPDRLKQMMENGVSRITAPGAPEGDGTGRFAHVAGMMVEVDLTGAAYEVTGDGTVTNPGSRITSITLEDGTAIVSAGAVVAGAPNVAVATNDFNSRGGDQFPFADPAVDSAALPRTVFPQPLQAIFRDYLVSLGTIDATTNGGAYADAVNQRILFP